MTYTKTLNIVGKKICCNNEDNEFLARDVIYTSRAYATMSVSVCLSVCLWRKCIVVTVHAGNTAAAPASEVEAVIRSPTNMAAADGGVISRYASQC